MRADAQARPLTAGALGGAIYPPVLRLTDAVMDQFNPVNLATVRRSLAATAATAGTAGTAGYRVRVDS